MLLRNNAIYLRLIYEPNGLESLLHNTFFEVFSEVDVLADGIGGNLLHVALNHQLDELLDAFDRESVQFRSRCQSGQGGREVLLRHR